MRSGMKFFCLTLITILVAGVTASAATPAAELAGEAQGAPEIKDPNPPYIDPSALPPQIESTGGPDAFGYVYIDSAEPGGPVYSWVDITGTGTLVTGFSSLDDGFAGPFPIGFSFPFYGVTQTDFFVGTNGFVSFGAGSTSLSNQCPLPSATAPSDVIALLWDDLNLNVSGAVYFQYFASCPVGSGECTVIEFSNIAHYGGTAGNAGTWEIILYPNAQVLFQFQDPGVETGSSSTTGIEGPGGAAGLSYGTCNTAGSITADLAILYQVTGWQLSAGGPTAQTGARGDVVDYTLTISNNEATASTYDVTYSGNSWITSGPATVGPVPSGASQDFTVSVTIPWTIGQCEGDMVTVAAFDVLGASQTLDLTTSGPGATSLYSNGPLVTHPGGGAGGADASAVQTALGMTLYGPSVSASTGYRIADDFTVPAGESWDLDRVVLYAYQTGSTTASTFTAGNLQIWDGSPDLPASTVVFGDTTTDRLTSSDWSNIYRVLDTTIAGSTRPIMANVCDVGTTLAAGTYWIDFQLAGSLASGPWAPPISILGQTNTGNALQQTVSTGVWAAVVDGAFPQGMPFEFVSCRAAADWGDAQGVGFPTTFAQDGARHLIPAAGNAILGALIDAEDDGQPTAGADGDDSNGLVDDDGVIFTSAIEPNTIAGLTVTVTGATTLQAWVDFNLDGDWDDAGEQIFTDQALAAGANPLTFPVPASAILGNTVARFRVSTAPGIGYGGEAPNGEVEDYLVTTVPVELQSFSIE